MDYKKLVENLKQWHRTICKMYGAAIRRKKNETADCF